MVAVKTAEKVAKAVKAAVDVADIAGKMSGISSINTVVTGINEAIEIATGGKGHGDEAILYASLGKLKVEIATDKMKVAFLDIIHEMTPYNFPKELSKEALKKAKEEKKMAIGFVQTIAEAQTPTGGKENHIENIWKVLFVGLRSISDQKILKEHLKKRILCMGKNHYEGISMSETLERSYSWLAEKISDKIDEFETRTVEKEKKVQKNSFQLIAEDFGKLFNFFKRR